MDKKKVLARIFAGFFIIMAFCTILSRAASSVLVAQVSVEKVKKGRLSYSYEGEGKIVPTEEKQLFLWPLQQVEKIAKAGSTVKAGDCLVQFRMEYLNKEVNQKQAEVEQLRLQKEQKEISAQGTEQVPASANAALMLDSAQIRLNEAMQKEAEAQAAYETPGNENSAEEISKQTQREQLYQTLQNAQAEVQAASQALTEAQNAYDLACQSDTAQYTNDANTRASALLGVQELGIQLQQAEDGLKLLQEYQKANGKICAKEDCVVLQAEVPVGAITTGAEVLTVGTGGWRLQGAVSEEEMEKLLSGTEVEITASKGGTRTVKIQTVETSKDQTPSIDPVNGTGSIEDSPVSALPGGSWYAPLPEGIEGTYDKNFRWKAKIETEEEYDQKLPLNALREGTDGTYCLILKEEQGMLGTVQKAKRIKVNVIEKDGENVAIQSELDSEDQIISSSEKYVEEGDQIRIKENEN